MNRIIDIADRDGLIKLIGKLRKEIAGAKVNIAEELTADSDNSTAAGSRAVYGFVRDAVAESGHLSAVIAESLPQEGEGNKMYLVPKSVGSQGNIYDEYLYIDGEWELIGNGDVDLSGYIRLDDIHVPTSEEIAAIISAAKGENGNG
ncbi:MAG: hypothetical protein ACI4KF_02270 [Huintestinicola sp.]